MNKKICKLENLPNEILIDIFKSLDVICIFRAFYGLNSRLNILIQSLDHCLTIHRSDADEISFPYIHTLIIKSGIEISFAHLTNVRRAVLHYNPGYSAKDIQVTIAPSLEHFSVLSPHPWLLSFSTDFTQKIFSNGFPYLKSCCLPRQSVILAADGWTQAPSLRIFKIGYVRFDVYEAILSSCPNLHSLEFTKWPKDNSTLQMKPHANLKRMVMHLSLDDFVDHSRLNNHFLSVSKLEQLIIHVTVREPARIKSMEDCDWFASIIDCYLPELHQFHCYVIFDPSTNIDEADHDDIVDQFKKNFEQKHHNRYQSKILSKFSSM